MNMTTPLPVFHPEWWDWLRPTQQQVLDLCRYARDNLSALGKCRVFVAQVVRPRVQQLVKTDNLTDLSDEEILSLLKGHLAIATAMDRVFEPLKDAPGLDFPPEVMKSVLFEAVLYTAAVDFAIATYEREAE